MITDEDINRRLLQKILNASDYINNKRQSSTDYIITSPFVADILTEYYDNLEKIKLRKKKLDSL